MVASEVKLVGTSVVSQMQQWQKDKVIRDLTYRDHRCKVSCLFVGGGVQSGLQVSIYCPTYNNLMV